MRCPFCSAADTRVTDTRLVERGNQVRRRRECQSCGGRFSTFEKVELVLPRVVKSDGRREPFDEQKLRGGMLRALEKRPVGTQAVEAAVSGILRRLWAGGEPEVASSRLGRWVMDCLRGMDQVAYVRFASVYRRFADVSDFREEVDRLQGETEMEARRRQLPLLPDELFSTDLAAPPANTPPERRRRGRAKPRVDQKAG